MNDFTTASNMGTKVLPKGSEFTIVLFENERSGIKYGQPCWTPGLNN